MRYGGCERRGFLKLVYKKKTASENRVEVATPRHTFRKIQEIHEKKKFFSPILFAFHRDEVGPRVNLGKHSEKKNSPNPIRIPGSKTSARPFFFFFSLQFQISLEKKSCE